MVKTLKKNINKDLITFTTVNIINFIVSHKIGLTYIYYQTYIDNFETSTYACDNSRMPSTYLKSMLIP